MYRVENLWQFVGICVLALGLVAASVSAYTFLSPKRAWAAKPTFIVDNRGVPSIADGDGGLTRTVNAIKSNAAWNGAGANAGTLLDATAGSVASFSVGDGTPMLNFRDPFNTCGSSGCLAAAFTGALQNPSGTWRIHDADIVTNVTDFNWTSEGEDPGGSGCFAEYYIEGVQVHEVGHGLGMGHSSVSGATMLPFVSSCDRGLASTNGDDEAGIRDLYDCEFIGAGQLVSCTVRADCCSAECAPFFPGGGTFCQ